MSIVCRMQTRIFTVNKTANGASSLALGALGPDGNSRIQPIAIGTAAIAGCHDCSSTDM